MLLIVTLHCFANWSALIASVTLYHKQTTTTMKKILTLSAIAIIFASGFANASTVKIKTVKATKIHYTKLSVKGFSIKGMQDTKDILLSATPKANA
jgi:hypothetical protein